MGIIKAAVDTVSGAFADQWLEVIEPDNMSGSTVFTRGVQVQTGNKRNSNRKGSPDSISNGSVIHVYPNQCMLLVEGGLVVDYSMEEGYYVVNNSTMPSLFNGEFGSAIEESFSRIKYGGITPLSQKVYYINLQEIKGIKFGTRAPVNYFDQFYNAELFLRAHGTYSIRITDPLLFYAEAIPRNSDRVDISDINEQYFSEFMEALQSAINQMSVDGVRISFISSKGRELSQYMRNILDDEWRTTRGMEIQSVGISNISYDDESKKLINMRNEGAMLSDPTIREGYVQGAIAQGIKSAGSNPNGAANSFMGIGMGMNAGGNFMGSASETNRIQMQQQQAAKPQTPAAPVSPQPGWKCECGQDNMGNFCLNCGKPKPAAPKIKCDKCGFEPDVSKTIPKFCPECGDPISAADII